MEPSPMVMLAMLTVLTMSPGMSMHAVVVVYGNKPDVDASFTDSADNVDRHVDADANSGGLYMASGLLVMLHVLTVLISRTCSSQFCMLL